jgi:hypothetical protein
MFATEIALIDFQALKKPQMHGNRNLQQYYKMNGATASGRHNIA